MQLKVLSKTLFRCIIDNRKKKKHKVLYHMHHHFSSEISYFTFWTKIYTYFQHFQFISILHKRLKAAIERYLRHEFIYRFPFVAASRTAKYKDKEGVLKHHHIKWIKCYKHLVYAINSKRSTQTGQILKPKRLIQLAHTEIPLPFHLILEHKYKDLKN